MLKAKEKKQAVLLGVRIGLMFLLAFSILVFAAYVILSQNFKKLLTDYTLQLVQSMVEQGVTAIEQELRTSQEEAAVLADAFSIPAGVEQTAVFPAVSSHTDILRMVYISEQGAVASDGRRHNPPRDRQDIKAAFRGETAFYGPCFNEENEYVICYSAPVFQDGKVAGVLTIEKDGYYFCSLIKDIRFADTGESYIINAEGTDIAVSDQNHIEWVNEKYNARRLLEENEDPTTRSIMELEQKGLDGNAGIGACYWDGGLYYLVYQPVPLANWVFLASLRQEEISAMTQSALVASITRGPVLSICIAAMILFTAIIVFWIISSWKKSEAMNEKLKEIASYDALTGAKNRNSYHAALDTLSAGIYRSLACIYIDANGLHELNNHLGHLAGDKMLKAVVTVLERFFEQNDIYRIGGDEFVVFCQDQDEQEICRKSELARKELETQGYEISIGIAWQDKDINVNGIISTAENRMQQDKQRYYRENGKERQIRTLDRELEKMLLEKQDADTFLSVLAPKFKGVYFVNLDSDTIRHLYLPSYFEEMLEEVGDIFSKALRLYAQQIVAPEYRREFQKFYNYSHVEELLTRNDFPEFIYQKTDGNWIKLKILKFKTYTEQNRETLWIFSNTASRDAMENRLSEDY